MDRTFIRSLIGFIAAQPNAPEVFHNTVRAVGELTARGRTPSEDELDALTDYVVARAATDAKRAAEKAAAEKQAA